MRKGVILLVRDVKPGFKNNPNAYKLVGDRFRRTLMVQKRG